MIDMGWFSNQDEFVPAVTQDEIDDLLKGAPDNLMVLAEQAKRAGNLKEAIEYYRLAGEAGVEKAYREIKDIRRREE